MTAYMQVLLLVAALSILGPSAQSCNDGSCDHGQLEIPGVIEDASSMLQVNLQHHKRQLISTEKSATSANKPESLTCSSFTTPENDDGGGNALYLDRHDVACGTNLDPQALSQWHLGGKPHHKIQFDYTCCSVPAGLTQCRKMNSGSNDDGGGDTRYFDRHNVACGSNEVLTQWKLKRTSHNAIAFDYTCCSVETYVTDCTSQSTPANVDGGGNALYLDRHNLHCASNKVMTQWKFVRTSSQDLHFDYTCCAIEDPAFATTATSTTSTTAGPLDLPSDISGPSLAQHLIIGASVFANTLASMATIQSVPFEGVQKRYFPEIASDNGGEYLHNDELRSYATLMLGYAANVYWFKNGANQHTDAAGHTTKTIPKPEISNMFPSLGAGYGQHWCEGDGAPNFDNDPEFTYSSAADIVKEFQSHRSHDTQASIYTWKRPHETIVTLAFRGSESPAFDVLLHGGLTAESLVAFTDSLDEVLKDWVGTDFNSAPMDDAICGNPRVMLQNGIVFAYLAIRGNVLEGLRESIRRATMARSGDGNPIKIFVTGHSLGAALASLATYDLWCNKVKQLTVDGLQHELFGTITFGHFHTMWKKESVEVYQQTVPVEKRMRVNACATTQEGIIANTKPLDVIVEQSAKNLCKPCGNPPDTSGLFGLLRAGAHASCKVAYDVCMAMHAGVSAVYQHILPNTFGACDIVGSVLPGLGPAGVLVENDGFFHPMDNDFQAAWVRQEPLVSHGDIIVGADCYGPSNSFLCHMLERYSQGLRRFSHFNTGGQCKPVNDPGDKLKLTPQVGGNFVEADFRRLNPNEKDASRSGNAVLTMQGDCNLVIYSRGRARWSTNTAGNSNAYFQYQADGNLVVYSQQGKALWSSETGGRATTSLEMQDDCNLVLYNGPQVVWDSGSSC